MSNTDLRLQEILSFLNETQIRATYAAVATIVGGAPHSIGGRLGARRPEASWVVSISTGLPTGYTSAQLHPHLFRTDYIIGTGAELLFQVTHRKRGGLGEPVSDRVCSLCGHAAQVLERIRNGSRAEYYRCSECAHVWTRKKSRVDQPPQPVASDDLKSST